MCGDFHSSMSTLKALLRSKDVLCLLQQIAAPRRAGAARLPLPRPCGRRDTLFPPHPPAAHPPPAFTSTQSPLPSPPPRGREKKKKRERQLRSPGPARAEVLPGAGGGGGSQPSPPPPAERSRTARRFPSSPSSRLPLANAYPARPYGKINPRHLPRSGEERGQRKPQTHQVRPEPTKTVPNPPNFLRRSPNS